MANDQTTRPDGISQHEWDMILDLRKRRVFDNGRNAGLMEAAQLADSWAAQCCGGSGEGGQGYINLAQSIRRLLKP